jgi:maltooligosyltrehalose trehalohydrolase
VIQSPVVNRRYPIGPHLSGSGQASLRVWAPDARRVDAVIASNSIPMAADKDGYWSVVVSAPPGTRYGFRLDAHDPVLADPASRWQPDGAEGLSAIFDPAGFTWHDQDWQGLSLRGQVLYEMHVGTYTQAGTWDAAADCLPRLKALGITVLEVMPVATAAGSFGWGYDGVFWLAPTTAYGTPHDFQHFVDRAHGLGLGVILDVVFNHFGPAGNVLPRFSPHYITDRHPNEWGDALNFDGPSADGMRELVLTAAEYWVREFHVDGFRLDATHQIMDSSPDHIVAALTRRAREAGAPRSVIVVAEHESQHAHLMRPASQGGYGIDGIFNEDFHHSLRVKLTGVREAYLSDYEGTSREWLSALQGFLFQGQYYSWQDAPRGAPALDRPPWQFVAFLENHDQVANLMSGARLRELTSPAWWRAASALLLLGPWTPLIFQGQEWGSRRPFLYFADHHPELQAAVRTGRAGFVSQFTRLQREDAGAGGHFVEIGLTAFNHSRLEHPDAVEEIPEWRLYRDALALRTTLPPMETAPLGSTVTDDVLIIRYRSAAQSSERLLVVNLGPDIRLETRPDPLLAPPSCGSWRVEFCTEDRAYGGRGVVKSKSPYGLTATGHATTLFVASSAAIASAGAPGV